VLTAMIVAVSMTFIDQTIVSVAAPTIQAHLGLTSTGMQWAVNAYLLALAACFAFGGRLADTVGHRTTVTWGVIIFAAASLMCGLTPTGRLAEAWLVTFRIVQGVGGAIMFPAALAIVVQTFELRQRGRALALFFGVAGGLTSVGPALGGFLTEWQWRAIFWINLPVAVIALVLISVARPVTEHRPAPMDYRGFVAIATGIALSIVGFQQSGVWGWHDARTILCVVGGAAVLIAFALLERGVTSPLIDVRIFANRSFLVQNLVLAVSSTVFIPVFFFASEYAQISLGESASEASLILLYLFIGFVIAAQIGGRILDRRGAKPTVVFGCALAAVGFELWARKVTGLDLGQQVPLVIMTGAGMGFMLGPATTDAVNRASRLSYGEATGITQTVRNYAASLGIAALGSLLVVQMKSRLTGSLVARGLPHARAAAQAKTLSQAHGTGGPIPHFVRLDFAYATRSVFEAMAVIMAVSAVIAFVGLKHGTQEA
ncbi:MAG: MFS transporter, partial [Thermoleophilia bacterium]|nr:MFS transporter [Thermoleophilia bacterium]